MPNAGISKLQLFPFLGGEGAGAGGGNTRQARKTNERHSTSIVNFKLAIRSHQFYS